MGLTVHHLQVSQSERIPWLCEELGIPYALKTYARSPLLSPPAYLALHPIGAAPVITDPDTDLTLAESNAVAEYIIHVYGGGRLTLKPGEATYAEYLYWLHFTNGTLQPAVGRILVVRGAGLDEDHNLRARYEARLARALAHLDARMVATGAWLAGAEFTVADVMVVFSLTTMRRFVPLDLSQYQGILGYLARVAERPAYVRAMEKGDPGMDWRAAMHGPPPELFGALRAKV
ncbi:hypothetical protein LTR53_007206 [Teratosphaeriaceae sp. CCFEE 6253]|nr:hypothetical protein LTR53_007206 [Teratosphaeriaceae sp. CCFEE 6253]